MFFKTRKALQNLDHALCKWYIERAFRLSKTDLKVRPIYHRLRNRIEGHICICFTAYTILLELERILKENDSSITSSTSGRTVSSIMTSTIFSATALGRKKI